VKDARAAMSDAERKSLTITASRATGDHGIVGAKDTGRALFRDRNRGRGIPQRRSARLRLRNLESHCRNSPSTNVAENRRLREASIHLPPRLASISRRLVFELKE
jgi:hypothetical protein